MAEGELAFSRSLCQKACLQVIYAQAERRSSSQKNASPSKSNRQQRPPTPATAVHVVEKVADALADVVSSFILQVARSSAARARNNGRSKCTFLDVLATLNSVSFSTQSTIRDIARYCTLQQVVFPVEVPEYPVLPSQTLTKRKHQSQLDIPSEDADASRPRTYLENWMPPIPSAHTFVSNPGVLAPPERSTPLSAPEQRRRMELSLARLREVSGTTQTASQAITQANNARSTGLSDNPFTSAPILVTPSDVSPRDPQANGSDIRTPLEDEGNNVDSNSKSVVETKYAISDQKRARVDRILAESGTIMLSGGASTAPTSGEPIAAPPTPGADSPAQTPRGGNAT